MPQKTVYAWLGWGVVLTLALLAARFTDLIAFSALNESDEPGFSAHGAMLKRSGEIRGDTLPNVLLKAGDQELRLGQSAWARFEVPQGSQEARVPLSALSTGSDPEWVKARPQMPFEIATDAARGQYRFDGHDLVFMGLRPGVYQSRVALWLRHGENRFTREDDFKKSSGNCEAYLQSKCVAAVSAPARVAALKSDGLTPLEALMEETRWIIQSLASVSLWVPAIWMVSVVWWRFGGRSACRFALSVFGPSATRWLGPVPVGKKSMGVKLR